MGYHLHSLDHYRSTGIVLVLRYRGVAQVSEKQMVEVVAAAYAAYDLLYDEYTAQCKPFDDECKAKRKPFDDECTAKCDLLYDEYTAECDLLYDECTAERKQFWDEFTA